MRNNERGIYVEALTAEVFKELHDILPDDIPEGKFLSTQENIRRIFEREYVEREERV